MKWGDVCNFFQTKYELKSLGNVLNEIGLVPKIFASTKYGSAKSTYLLQNTTNSRPNNI